MVCESLGLEPGECLFADGSANNVAAAAEVGLICHRYTRAADARGEDGGGSCCVSAALNAQAQQDRGGSNRGPL